MRHAFFFGSPTAPNGLLSITDEQIMWLERIFCKEPGASCCLNDAMNSKQQQHFAQSSCFTESEPNSENTLHHLIQFCLGISCLLVNKMYALYHTGKVQLTFFSNTYFQNLCLQS